MIVRALVAAKEQKRLGGWRPALLVLPAIGAALVPGLTCPACWPGYAALLSALGLGFIPTLPYLLPLTASLLFLSVAALTFRSDTKLPVAVGLIASVVILLGKFVFELSPMIYAGVGLLIAASLWKLRRPAAAAACPACAPVKAARHGGATTSSMEGR